MRSRRGVVWPYMLLSVALLGALGFGWYQTQQRNRLAMDVENKYMSAFHKLKWNSENIEERTANLMATNDREIQESLLADLRVYSAQAVENMSVLPLMTMNTPRITNFLNILQQVSDEYHYKLSEGQALGEEEWSRLTELRRQAVFFEDELANLLGLIGNNMVRWSATAIVTAPSQTGDGGTPITQSVMQLDKALVPPPGEEKALSPANDPLARPRTDPGPRVDTATAVNAVKRFMAREVPLKGEPTLTGQSDPKDEGFFSLYFFDAQKVNGTPLNFGVSVHGGHVAFLIDGRPVKERTLTEAHLVPRARQMLSQWGYPNAEFVSVAENDGTLMMDFAPREQGISILTELIKVSLTMDNGELVGFDARNYWVNRYDRKLGQPKLSASQARTKLAPRLKVQGEAQLSIVADRLSRERLAWEFKAQHDNQRYLVYIDAESGKELNVIRLIGDPTPPMNEG